MTVYRPSTDPFWIGDPFTDFKDFVPSVHKTTVGECCEPNTILAYLNDIKECLEETSEDYEKKVIPLCEQLDDETEVLFFRIIETIYDKKTDTSTTTKKDVLTDLTTEYTVVDETKVAGQKVKTVEQSDAVLNSGVQNSWGNF